MQMQMQHAGYVLHITTEHTSSFHIFTSYLIQLVLVTCDCKFGDIVIGRILFLDYHAVLIEITKSSTITFPAIITRALSSIKPSAHALHGISCMLQQLHAGKGVAKGQGPGRDKDVILFLGTLHGISCTSRQ